VVLRLKPAAGINEGVEDPHEWLAGIGVDAENKWRLEMPVVIALDLHDHVQGIGDVLTVFDDDRTHDGLVGGRVALETRKVDPLANRLAADRYLVHPTAATLGKTVNRRAGVKRHLVRRRLDLDTLNPWSGLDADPVF